LQEVVSKVKSTTFTYSNLANYWAPLADYNEDEDGEDIINSLSDAEVQQDLRAMIHNWVNQRISKNRPFQIKPSTMIVDSGATSHFMRAEENLPHTGISTKVVFLPNGKQIKASHTTELPFY
jgi:hypothetical protein